MGGGAGLSAGKDKLTQILKEFGAKVTSSVSGTTSILVAGRDPGLSKVETAVAKKVKIVSLQGLRSIMSGSTVEEAAPAELDPAGFSGGFVKRGGAANGLACGRSAEQLMQLTSAAKAPPLALKRSCDDVGESSTVEPIPVKKVKRAKAKRVWDLWEDECEDDDDDVRECIKCGYKNTREWCPSCGRPMDPDMWG